jgi:hypothetical protein
LAVANNTQVACNAVRAELAGLPNKASFRTDCTALPLIVTAARDYPYWGTITPRTRVAVTYQTVPLIPIPGALTGRMTITRTVAARVTEDN